MIVVEFCGAPGCGKSYIADLVEKELEKKNIRLINLYESQMKRDSLFYPFKKMVALVRKIHRNYSASIKEERNAINAYIAENGLEASSYQFYYGLLDEIYDIKHNRKYDVVLGNEGIVQSITSLSHNRFLDHSIDSVIYEADNNYYAKNKVVIFWCDVNIDTNIERIKRRNRSNDRFLLESEEEMIKALELKKSNIKYVMESLKNPKIIKVDVLDSKKALQQIMTEMEKLGI